MATDETAESGTQAQEAQKYKYWAFVSFSHRDEKVSAWLHRSIEGYRIPRHFVGRQSVTGAVPRRLYPLFRDREEMASDDIQPGGPYYSGEHLVSVADRLHMDPWSLFLRPARIAVVAVSIRPSTWLKLHQCLA